MKDCTILLILLVIMVGCLAGLGWWQSTMLTELRLEKIRHPFSDFTTRYFDGMRLIARNDSPLKWHEVMGSGDIKSLCMETDAMMKLWDEMTEDMNTKNVDFGFD